MTMQHLQIIKMQGETIFFLMNSLRNIQTKIAQGPNIHYYSRAVIVLMTHFCAITSEFKFFFRF